MSEEQAHREAQNARMMQLLAKALGVLATLLLAAVAVGMGFFIGKRTYAEKWSILVTATGLATYVGIALIDVRSALLVWVVTAPFARFVHLNIDLGRGIPNLTLNRIMTGVLLVLILAQLATRRRRPVRVIWLDVFLLLFCIAGLLSTPSAVLGFRTAVQSYFDLLVIPIAIYYLARNVITDQRGLRSVMVALVIIGTYLGLLAIREQLTGVVWFYPEDRSVQYTKSIRRVVGLLGNPAFTAATIGMCVPWAWYLLLNAQRRRAWLLLGIGIMMAGVYFCMNRSGWVALVIALTVMALLMHRFRRIFLAMVLVGAAVAVVYWALIVTSTTVTERLKAVGPIEYRRETWIIALRMIEDNPIYGVGYENFQFFYQRYGRWDINLRALPTPHNTLLWVMLMGGVIAFVPFMGFLAVLALSPLGWYLRSRVEGENAAFPDAELAATFLASMSAILAPAMVMDALTGYYNTMVMFFIIGAFFGAVMGERRLAARLGNRASQANLAGQA